MKIESILDTDFYKFTVGQFAFTKYRNVKTSYSMQVRNAATLNIFQYISDVQFVEAVNALKQLSLSKAERFYLESLEVFSSEYLDFLSNRPMANVSVWFKNGLPCVSGNWCECMLFETFCASILNEMFAAGYSETNVIPLSGASIVGMERLRHKVQKVNEYNKKNSKPLNIVEFGTRRRLSYEWQQNVLRGLIANDTISGTSNVNFARELTIPVLGTMGHEFFMAMQGIHPAHLSQRRGMVEWKEFYQDKFLIVLNDTLGTKKFFRDFHKDLANQYAGLRHDSGNPFDWASEMISMYKRFDIDPKTKKLFFSDGLDIDTAIALHKCMHDKINVAFGIGTNLTNDTILPVPQSVMKMTDCNGQPVAKISNNPDKATCPNEQYLAYLKHAAENL